MHKFRLYLTQLLGVILLLCSYLVENPPDRLSVLHVAPHPNHESVIRNAHRDSKMEVAGAHVTSTTETGKGHKTKITKYTPLDVMMPAPAPMPYNQAVAVKHTLPLPTGYSYLYYKEVNPPPPKRC